MGDYNLSFLVIWSMLLVCINSFSFLLSIKVSDFQGRIDVKATRTFYFWSVKM